MTARILDLTPSDRPGTLLAIASALIEDVGLVVHGIGIHRHSVRGNRWVYPPAHVFKGPAGEREYNAIVEPADDNARRDFEAAVLTAFDAWQGGEPAEADQ